MKTFSRLFISVTLIFLFSLCTAYSQTIIPGGNVSGTWTAANSPYQVTGDITIPLASTLTIEPGVVVEFQGHYQLIVNGRILAIGDQSNSIIFTAQDTVNGWHGIDLINLNTNGMDSSKFIYCQFSFGRAVGSTDPEKRGGAIYAEESSNILFQYCTFVKNYADYDGGAVCLLQNSSPDFEFCTFDYNTCYFYGGAFYISASSPTIKNSVIKNGSATIFAAGIAGWDGSMFRVENCKIIDNSAGAVCGIYTAVNSAPVIVNCLFSGNQTVFGNGGAMGFSVSNPTIINCTIADNNAVQNGAGIWFFQSTGEVKNCIVWDNQPNGLFFDQSTITVEYSNLSSTISGTGNISDNPLFVGSGDDPFSVQGSSPSCNTGTPDTTGLGVPLLDLAGNLRISEGRIDMGAYEYAAPIPVELIFFKSTVSGNSVTLNWETATELNNSGFEVQRKSNKSSDWTILEFMEGQGTTSELTSYTYNDFVSLPGIYNYRIKQLDFDGNYTFHNLSEEVLIGIPNKFALAQNYPNPFNRTTKISYTIANVVSGFNHSKNVILKIYDFLGNEVEILVDAIHEPGNYEVIWDASHFSSGVYFYTISAGEFLQSKKMILLK